MTPTFTGELQLAGWSESHTGGCKVSFWLQSPDELAAFRALTVRKGNTAGHRFMAALVEIGDDELPIEPANESCRCEACVPQGGLMHPQNVRMIVCATCGNKRCPHATDHRNLCTGSNEVGQKGSSWQDVKPRERLADACYRTVLWCNEPSFWMFLNYFSFACAPNAPLVKSAETAAIFVRMVCNVTSRKELDTNNEANKTWHREIRQPYADYLKRLEAA